MLSKANKPSSSYYATYLAKRLNLLTAGVHLVEIDLLHESRPVLAQLPSYPDAAAYSVAVILPQPDVLSGEMHWYSTRPAIPLPNILLPLTNDVSVPFPLQPAYDASFMSTPIYAWLIDYEALPPNFERYSAADQASIKSILAGIRQAAADDV